MESRLDAVASWAPSTGAVRAGGTRAYLERRTREGLSKREIIRCLKRYVARELLLLIKNAAEERPDLKLPSIAA